MPSNMWVRSMVKFCDRNVSTSLIVDYFGLNPCQHDATQSESAKKPIPTTTVGRGVVRVIKAQNTAKMIAQTTNMRRILLFCFGFVLLLFGCVSKIILYYPHLYDRRCAFNNLRRCFQSGMVASIKA